MISGPKSETKLLLLAICIALLFDISSAARQPFPAPWSCSKYPGPGCSKVRGKPFCASNGQTYYNECVFCQDAKADPNLKLKHLGGHCH